LGMITLRPFRILVMPTQKYGTRLVLANVNKNDLNKSFQKLVRTVLQLRNAQHLSVWSIISSQNRLLLLNGLLDVYSGFTFQSRDELFFENQNQTENCGSPPETC